MGLWGLHRSKVAPAMNCKLFMCSTLFVVDGICHGIVRTAELEGWHLPELFTTDEALQISNCWEWKIVGPELTSVHVSKLCHHFFQHVCSFQTHDAPHAHGYGNALIWFPSAHDRHDARWMGGRISKAFDTSHIRGHPKL